MLLQATDLQYLGIEGLKLLLMVITGSTITHQSWKLQED